MAAGDDFQALVLKGVTSLCNEELGRGAFGRVFEVKYCGMVFAAKEIHSILIDGVGQVQMQRTVQSFLRECQQCSKLRHPNIIQFLGVFYPTLAGMPPHGRLPIMVMEMMANSLTSLVDKYENIPLQLKFSIVHDVSLGLYYLHNHDPPIVHRDLSPNNILLTAHFVAKISDLGVAKAIEAGSRKKMTTAPGTVDFMPPEGLSPDPHYGPPLDVFSFAAIVLHTFNQQWPSPTERTKLDPITNKVIGFTEVERRQQYLDKLRAEVKEITPLVEECLEYDPSKRPTIATVCEQIKMSKEFYFKGYSDDIISLHKDLEVRIAEMDDLLHEVAQLKCDLSERDLEINDLTSENEHLRKQLVSIFHLSFEIYLSYSSYCTVTIEEKITL